MHHRKINKQTQYINFIAHLCCTTKPNPKYFVAFTCYILSTFYTSLSLSPSRDFYSKFIHPFTAIDLWFEKILFQASCYSIKQMILVHIEEKCSFNLQTEYTWREWCVWIYTGWPHLALHKNYSEERMNILWWFLDLFVQFTYVFVSSLIEIHWEIFT